MGNGSGSRTEYTSDCICGSSCADRDESRISLFAMGNDERLVSTQPGSDLSGLAVERIYASRDSQELGRLCLWKLDDRRTAGNLVHLCSEQERMARALHCRIASGEHRHHRLLATATEGMARQTLPSLGGQSLASSSDGSNGDIRQDSREKDSAPAHTATL